MDEGGDMIRARLRNGLSRGIMALLDLALYAIPSWIHPNHLTHARWILTVPTVVLAHLERPWLSVGALIASSACDILDGHLARRRGRTTEAGAHLDARADKIFIHGTLWGACLGRVDPAIAIAVSGLDIILTVLRWYKDHRGVTGKSNIWGKRKTWAQSFALAFVLSQSSFFLPLAPWVFWLAIACALQSVRAHLQDLHQQTPPSP